jgi:hypothetical protein
MVSGELPMPAIPPISIDLYAQDERYCSQPMPPALKEKNRKSFAELLEWVLQMARFRG